MADGRTFEEILEELDAVAAEYEIGEAVALLLRKIDELHQPDRETGVTIWCGACATSWPCPTARLLGR